MDCPSPGNGGPPSLTSLCSPWCPTQAAFGLSGAFACVGRTLLCNLFVAPSYPSWLMVRSVQPRNKRNTVTLVIGSLRPLCDSRSVISGGYGATNLQLRRAPLHRDLGNHSGLRPRLRPLPRLCPTPPQCS